MSVTSVTPSLVGSGSVLAQDNAYGSLRAEDFITMMITQLQNQDPFNPAETQDLLAQISSIRDLEATNQMTKTFSELLLQQRLSSGASMIGKTIMGTGTDGSSITGVVDRVSVSGDQVSLVVGSVWVPLSRVTQIT